METIAKITKYILAPFKRYLLSPQIRFSNHFRSFQLNEREKMVQLSMRFAKACRVPGDYWEFGVYNGGTFIPAYHFAQYAGLRKMRFLAFDSFDGLPDVKGIDAQVSMYAEGEYRFSIEQFNKRLRSSKVDLAKVECIPGWFDKSLNEETRKKLSSNTAAIVWIDCDLYESTVPILRFITPHLVDGSMIIFDDWFAFRGNPDRGEQKAFKEWIEANPKLRVSEYRKFGWNGCAFLVHSAKTE